MGRGAWWATVHRVAPSQTGLKQLSTHAADEQTTLWQFLGKSKGHSHTYTSIHSPSNLPPIHAATEQ